MYPLTADRAVELFDANYPIYLLYPDNTEALAFDRDEIITFSSEGLCGITRADWEISPTYAAQRAASRNNHGDNQGRLESDLLYSGDNRFGIYQIPDGVEEARDFRFASMRELESHGLSPDRENYDLVYTGNLDTGDTVASLNNIYADFQGENPDRPTDYAARSVSVSDIIVLNWQGNISSHYVDRVGFRELSAFLGEENKREWSHMAAQPIATETETGHSTESQIAGFSELPPPEPTVAGLEADVKAGKSISLMDLSKALGAERKPVETKGKQSLLARLDKAKQQVEQNRQPETAVSKKDRGYD
jgi:hypothetical protein